MKKSAAKLAVEFVILSTLALLTSCPYGLPSYMFSDTTVEERISGITTLDAPSVTSTKYSFVVITDSHFGSVKKERREDAFLQKLNSLLAGGDETKPRFIVNLGDTLDGGRDGETALFNQAAQKWTDAANAAGLADFKVYSMLGNHDLYNNGWKTWKSRIWPGTSYYRFSVPAAGATFSFYCLDSGNSTLGSRQLENLKSSLAGDPNPKIVFVHFPIFGAGRTYGTMHNSVERNILISTFASRNVKYVFEGHQHRHSETDLKKFKEVVLPSFFYDYQFALVTVDSASQSVSYQIIGY